MGSTLPMTLVASGFIGDPFTNGVIHFTVKEGTTYRIAIVGRAATEVGGYARGSRSLDARV
jgi:hypothetical protein